MSRYIQFSLSEKLYNALTRASRGSNASPTVFCADHVRQWLGALADSDTDADSPFASDDTTYGRWQKQITQLLAAGELDPDKSYLTGTIAVLLGLDYTQSNTTKVSHFLRMTGWTKGDYVGRSPTWRMPGVLQDATPAIDEFPWSRVVDEFKTTPGTYTLLELWRSIRPDRPHDVGGLSDLRQALVVAGWTIDSDGYQLGDTRMATPASWAAKLPSMFRRKVK